MNKQTEFVLTMLKNPDIKTILNVGYRFDSDQTIQKTIEADGKIFYVLEAWMENCEQLRLQNICKRVYCGDVRNIDKLNRKFDAIIWLHGPEHITWKDFMQTYRKIENTANKLIIYQGPIGEYPQDAIYNNPYEVHVETLVPTRFTVLGYQVVLHDKDGERTFSAWKQK